MRSLHNYFLLSLVRLVDGERGASFFVQLLKGSRSKKVTSLARRRNLWGYFNLFSLAHRDILKGMFDRLVDQDLLGKTRVTDGQGYSYDVIRLTPSGEAYMEMKSTRFQPPLTRCLDTNIAHLALQKDLVTDKYDLSGLRDTEGAPYPVTL